MVQFEQIELTMNPNRMFIQIAPICAFVFTIVALVWLFVSMQPLMNL